MLMSVGQGAGRRAETLGCAHVPTPRGWLADAGVVAQLVTISSQLRGVEGLLRVAFGQGEGDVGLVGRRSAGSGRSCRCWRRFGDDGEDAGGDAGLLGTPVTVMVLGSGRDTEMTGFSMAFSFGRAKPGNEKLIRGLRGIQVPFFFGE